MNWRQPGAALPTASTSDPMAWIVLNIDNLAATLAAKKFTFILLVPLLIALILSTFLVSFNYELITVIRILLALLAGNLSICTWRNWRVLSTAVTMIHIGVLLVLGGGLWGAAGYIATINIYEGEGSATAYRWDQQQDSDLGFLLNITKIHQKLYPTTVKIGILKNGKKIKLEQINTGQSFTFDQNKIAVKDLDIANKNLKLIITTKGKSQEYYTGGSHKQLANSALAFDLVAYSTPAIKKAWVDLEIHKQGKIVAQGQSTVNHPLKWQGLKFYHTQTSHDEYGRAFAGIQIVNDPGIPMVYSGFFMLFVGGLLLLLKKM